MGDGGGKALLERSHGFFLRLLQLLLNLCLEGNVALHEVGEFGLTLLVDGRRKLALAFEEILVFLVELVFGALQFLFVLLAQSLRLCLDNAHGWHGLKHLVVAQVAEDARRGVSCRGFFYGSFLCLQGCARKEQGGHEAES